MVLFSSLAFTFLERPSRYIGYFFFFRFAMRHICVDDYEKEAHAKLSQQALDYYRSGADEEITLRANVESFKKWKILPRFMKDVSAVSMELDVFGDKVSCPIGASPTAMHKVRFHEVCEFYVNNSSTNSLFCHKSSHIRTVNWALVML